MKFGNNSPNILLMTILRRLRISLVIYCNLFLKSFWFNWINNNKNNKNGIQPTFSLLVSTSRELAETIHYVLNDSSKIDSMLSLGDYDYTLHSLELLLHKKCKGCHTLLIKLYYFNWIEIVVESIHEPYFGESRFIWKR